MSTSAPQEFDLVEVSTQEQPPRRTAALGGIAGSLGCGVVLAVLGYAWWLHGADPESYNRTVQEDEVLEWASTGGFLLAALLAWLAARLQWQSERRLPWFLIGLGLFSFVVAMEEISWGQRVFGYQPPQYFLAHNYQQEFNVHNLISTDLRQLGLKAVMLGYGVLLTLFALIPPLKRLLNRLGVVAPPLSLVPGFLAAYFLYSEYPWDHSGEWVEMMVGLCFAFSMLGAWIWARRESATDSVSEPAIPKRRTVAVLVTAGLVLGFGVAGAGFTRAQRANNPGLVEAAEKETEALRRDFLRGMAVSNCSIHKRLYTFVQQREQTGLLEGQFAALKDQGLPEARADFFLDPWNSPYWIRDRCSKSRGKRLTFIYSFGPNRKRDSSRYEILGDDVGAWIRQRPLD